VVMAVAAPDKVADEEEDEETDVRRTNAHTGQWTIIHLKHAEKDSTLKTRQSPAIQTRPETTNKLSTTAVSQDPSSPTASTSNMPGINPTKSTQAQHPHRLRWQEIAT